LLGTRAGGDGPTDRPAASRERRTVPDETARLVDREAQQRRLAGDPAVDVLFLLWCPEGLEQVLAHEGDLEDARVHRVPPHAIAARPPEFGPGFPRQRPSGTRREDPVLLIDPVDLRR